MRKKLNIIHLIAGMGVGGAEKVIVDLLEGVNSEKFNVKVVYWSSRDDLIKIRKCPATQVVKLSFDKIVSFKSILKLANLLKNLKADLLQTHLIDADLIGTFAAKIAGVPVLNTIHSYPYPIKRSHCIRYKALSLFVKRMICVSETVKKHVISHTKIIQNKFLVVHNGIDVEKYSVKTSDELRINLRKSLGIKSNYKVIGNVSRLIEDKGHKYLLEAIPEVLKRHPNTQFLIVGDGELKGSLIELSEQLNITKNVIFAGSCSNISELLDIMDIFVFPTFNEALGICVLEAMCMGKPIIATDDAAVPELINRNKEGILIEPGNHKIISRALIDLLNDPNKCKIMGKAARSRVNKFSNKRMVQKMEDIYINLTT